MSEKELNEELNGIMKELQFLEQKKQQLTTRAVEIQGVLKLVQQGKIQFTKVKKDDKN